MKSYVVIFHWRNYILCKIYFLFSKI